MKIDLNELEALARAATPGPWGLNRHGAVIGGPVQQYANRKGQNQLAMATAADWMRLDEMACNAAHIAAANPAAVLELIALARQADGAETLAIPLVSGEELLARTQPLPKWIDDMKGGGPTTDSLIEYIEQLRGAPRAQQPAPGAAVVVKDFDIEDAQVLFSAAENMRSADKTGPVVDARFRIAYKVEQIAKRMFAQPPAGAQPVQQPAPHVQRWQDRYNHGVGAPAKIECMRLEIEDWRALFAALGPAASVQPDADLVRRLTHERDALGQAIADAALKAGMHNGEVPLAGPHLIMLAQHMGDAATVQPDCGRDAALMNVKALAWKWHRESVKQGFACSEPAQELFEVLGWPADPGHPPANVTHAGELSDEQIKEIIFDCHAEDGMGQELDLTKLCRAILAAAKKGGA